MGEVVLLLLCLGGFSIFLSTVDIRRFQQPHRLLLLLLLLLPVG